MKFIHNIAVFMLLALACIAISCSDQKEQVVLTRAEALMEPHPDSAMMLLSSIDKRELSGDRQKARYALLMSMALDKNYIDTTTFDVLQPAIDYYSENGSPNEKLRTYYYQGVIFFNQGNQDNALNSFIKALDISYNCTDSLTIARLLVMQGEIYGSFYDFDAYISCNIKASKIFEKFGIRKDEVGCLLNALNGCVITENEFLGDSILKCIRRFSSLTEIQQHTLESHKLLHALKFGTEDEIKNLILDREGDIGSQNDVLTLALAYNNIGNNKKAKELLDCVENSSQVYDTIRFLSIAVPALEGLGNYKEALSFYKTFSHKLDSIDLLRFDQKSQSVEEKHRIELEAQSDAQHKSRIIWGCIGGIALLSMAIVTLFLLFRSNKSQKNLALERAKTSELENEQLKLANEMALQKAKIAELENERLSSEKEKLVLENKYLQLERDNKALEAENLAHRLEALEDESENLKAVIANKEELPVEVQNEIRVRIEMLNALLASYITNNDKYKNPYDAWIKELTDNKMEFMNSTRLAFQVSHPRFIKYFEDHELTIDEVNYVCLYAIGLRGKEVGNYMKKRSHVNTSSAIRKKLGIDKHETNIGIYVRKLLNNL